MLHDINLKSESLSSQAAAKANYISVKMVDTESDMEDLMQTTAKDFYDTKKEYYRFLSLVF
jgi:hypothetical protein